MTIEKRTTENGRAPFWPLFQRNAAGFLLGPLPMLLVWPENLGQVLFFCTLAAAMMFMAAHQNGHLLPDRPVLAWAVCLLAVPTPMTLTTYMLKKNNIMRLDESPFRLIVISLAVMVTAALLATARRRAGEHSRLARTLRPFDFHKRSKRRTDRERSGGASIRQVSTDDRSARLSSGN